MAASSARRGSRSELSFDSISSRRVASCSHAEARGAGAGAGAGRSVRRIRSPALGATCAHAGTVLLPRERDGVKKIATQVGVRPCQPRFLIGMARLPITACRVLPFYSYAAPVSLLAVGATGRTAGRLLWEIPPPS